MSIITPLTAGIEISNSFAGSQGRAVARPGPEQYTADPFSSDRAALAQQQGTPQPIDSFERSSTENVQPSNESVSVSSSTGGGRSKGNLTAERAIQIYQAVSSLL